MPEKWVFDTVVLSNFLLTNASFILEKRYGRHGILTWQVFDEISSGFSEFPLLKEIQKLIQRKTLALKALSKSEQDHFLGLINHLGKGEASCIALAKEQGAIVLTDDRTARLRCSQLNSRYSGTIGILKASYLDGQIELQEADAILQRMINQGFYSPVRTISDIV